MGVCCASEEDVLTNAPAAAQSGAAGKGKGKKAPKAAVVPQLKDLPEVKWEKMSDVYAKFENSLPFNRIMIGDMMSKIAEAEKDAKANTAADAEEVEPFVTLQSLRKALPTEAWRPLLDPESALAKVLTSEAFKTKG